MRTLRFICAVLFVGFLALQVPCRAQDLSAILAQLSDPSPSARMAAFYMLQDASRLTGDDATKVSLIGLLGRETAYVATAPEENDGWGSYYGDVVGAVAALKDVRAAANLLQVIQTGGMATSGLAALGDAALNGVIARLDEPDPLVTTGAAMTLVKFLDPANSVGLVDPADPSKIHAALQKAAQSSNPFTASIAQSGLAKLGGTGTAAGTVVLVPQASLSLNAGGSVTLTITVTNRGSGSATQVKLLSVTLSGTGIDTASTTTTDLSPSASSIYVLSGTVPSSASGSILPLKINGTYQNGSFGGSLRLRVP